MGHRVPWCDWYCRKSAARGKLGHKRASSRLPEAATCLEINAPLRRLSPDSARPSLPENSVTCPRWRVCGISIDDPAENCFLAGLCALFWAEVKLGTFRLAGGRKPAGPAGGVSRVRTAWVKFQALPFSSLRCSGNYQPAPSVAANTTLRRQLPPLTSVDRCSTTVQWAVFSPPLPW